MNNILIYGGTFDPIHNGHIKTAINIQNYFNFKKFIFLPCKNPILKRKSIATSYQRIKMIELSLSKLGKSFSIGLQEMNRTTESYTIYTLCQFRNQFGKNIPITLVVGTDVFNKIYTWFLWKKILCFSNLLIINRPQNLIYSTKIAKNFFSNYIIKNNKLLTISNSGMLCFFNAGNFTISSTMIRSHILQNKNLKNLLPKSVIQYIKINNLYK